MSLTKTSHLIVFNAGHGAMYGHLTSHILRASVHRQYRGADKSLARPGRKQATATEDFEFHISY